MLNKFDNIIFDLDGTIVNSSQEVLLCFDKAYKKANYKIDYERLTPNVIGPPLKDIVKLITPELNDEEKIPEIIKYYEEIYDYDENDISSMYEGLFDFLTNLKKANKKLFIATYKPIKPTMRILKHFGLNMFDDIYTIDKFGQHITKALMISDILEKYNLKQDKTVMIGDAPSDMLAAKEAKITSIGVLWGYGTDKTNLIKHANYIANSINDLSDLI